MADEAKMDAITIVAISSINVNPFEYLDTKKRRIISAFFSSIVIIKSAYNSGE